MTNTPNTPYNQHTNQPAGFHRPPVIVKGETAKQFLGTLALTALAIALILIVQTFTTNDSGAVTIPPEGCETYTVAPGDTLTRIAGDHARTVDELVWWNGIDNPDLIIVGETMCVTEPRWASEMRPVQFRTNDNPIGSISDLLAESNWQTVTIPATTNGDSQPPFEIRAAAWQAFGRHGLDVYVNSLEIARCESSFRADAHRTTSNPARLLGDRSIWQINYIHDGWLQNLGIIETAADLFDPHTNAQAALALYERAGNTFQDWYMSQHCWEA